MECNHKWIDMEDGSLDKFCVKCRKFAKQGSLTMPGTTATENSVLINLNPPTPEEIVERLHEQLSRSTMMAMARAGRR